jgi:hypothetical protein
MKGNSKNKNAIDFELLKNSLPPTTALFKLPKK